MPRIIKEPTVRRNEILETAERFVYTKGYEQMTVQDILDALQISKGAFYHYFDSKQALLEALIDRIVDQVLPLMNMIVDDPTRPALEKFQAFFSTAASWKTAKKAYLLPLFRVWYHDDNVLFRQKQSAAIIKRAAPLLSAIVQQGALEGVFDVAYPDQASQLIMLILLGAGDTVAGLLMSCEECNNLEKASQITAAYTEALERILGVPQGTLQIVDHKILEEWFDSSSYEILTDGPVSKESQK